MSHALLYPTVSPMAGLETGEAAINYKFNGYSNLITG
jgi:hypothetical protein